MKKGIVTIGGVIFVIIVKHPFDGWCQTPGDCSAELSVFRKFSFFSSNYRSQYILRKVYIFLLAVLGF